MRVVFCGTPDFALPSLRSLLASHHQVVGVVTQPDKPKGRQRRFSASPVKELAVSEGLEVQQPASLKDEEFLSWLRQRSPDALVVVAFGKILPPVVLELPPYGCINLHASLLPRYRGAAPIHRALIAGEKETGVTTMFMVPELDAGDVILQQKVAIGPRETAGELHERLAVLGAELLVETLDLLEQGKAPRFPQDETLATYAPPLGPEDERIVWSDPAEAVFNRVRGLNPWPGAYSVWRGKRLKIWWVEPKEKATIPDPRPGRIVAVDSDGIEVTCGGGQAVVLKQVQPEGKNPMAVSEFIRGYRPRLGEEFD
jgi:methionyl-tRNA formyltransferase